MEVAVAEGVTTVAMEEMGLVGKVSLVATLLLHSDLVVAHLAVVGVGRVDQEPMLQLIVVTLVVLEESAFCRLYLAYRRIIVLAGPADHMVWPQMERREQ